MRITPNRRYEKMKKHLFTVLAMSTFFVYVFIPAIFSFGAEEITLNFYRAELKSVLQTLTQETGINLIASTELNSYPVSVYLKDADRTQVVDVILKANGLYREKIEGTEIYLVKKSSIPLLPPPPLSSRTFFLQYAKADTLGELLAPLLSTGGSIIRDTRTNSITVRDTDENLKQINDIISSLDKMVSQVSIEAVLVELSEDAIKDLGIAWNVEAGFSGPALDTSFPWQESYSRKIVGPRATTATSDPQFILGTLSLQALTANLRLLQSEGKANILANPRITTLNDKPAEIKIIKNTAVAPKVTETEGQRIITEYEYRDVGVALKVVPKINQEGYITLEVEPVVSSAVKSTVFVDPPAVDTYERRVKTSVIIKNGDTLVIGGLLRQDTRKTTNKMPFLGDILPFLFNNRASNSEKTDLVIFLTPKIITAEEAKVVAEVEKRRILPEN